MNGYAQQVTRQVPTGYETKFWAYTPPSYDDEGPGHPLLVCLHGGSSIGDDLNMLLEGTHETPAYLISESRWNTDLPFVVISPQLKRDLSVPNYKEQEWAPDLVNEVIEFVKSNYNVDENRIYVTGISLGGGGVWNYAASYPDQVAAILPMGSKTPLGQACVLKDIPTWAFHGENDALVTPSFTRDMVNAMNNCNPSGLYKANATVSFSMGHEVWNQVFNMQGGYDIYHWMLSFEKGNHSNKAPFVFTGLDRKIAVRPGPIYLSSEFFDSDGTIDLVQWTQTGGNPALTLEETNTKMLKIVNPSVGTFTFRLTATDNDNATSYDEIQIQILPANESLAITSFSLTNSSQQPIAPLSDNLVYLLPSPSNNRLNILASATVGTSSIRFSINSDQRVSWIGSRTNAALAVINQDWSVTPGEYLVCATPFESVSGGAEGTSLCYKITFTDEPLETTKYYLLPDSEVSVLTSWKTGLDGSGVSPGSFAADNQWFIIAGNASLTNSLNLTGTNTRLVVRSGGDLSISGAGNLSGAFYVEGNGMVRVNTSNAITFNGVSSTSSIEYGPNANSFPALSSEGLSYGNLTLKGVGPKTSGTSRVQGNLIAEQGVDIRGGEFYVEGNVSVKTASSITYSLRFDGYGIQTFDFPPAYTLRNMFISPGSRVKLSSNSATTLTLNSGTAGLSISDRGFLILNGHTLSVTGNCGINTTNTTGTIDCEGGSLLINTGVKAVNIYPERGKNRLNKLDIIASGNVTIRDSLYITESFRINNGTLNTTSLLTLESSPTFTAYVSRITGNPTINGNVNYQRNIEPGRKYKYLAFPVKNIQVADVQDHIPITGSFPQTSQGDGMTANPSFFYYNGTLATPENIDLGWTDFPAATNAEDLMFGRGYSTFIRESSEHKKLVLTGPLHIGNFNYSSVLTSNSTSNPNLGWNLVANPYASTITWNTGWTKTNVSPIVYVRDNNTGSVLEWDGSIGDEEFGGVIASGQSFWVRTLNGSPVLTITEQAKLEQGDASFYRTGSDDVVSLRIQLKQNDRIDNTYLKFSNVGKVKFDDTLDGVKMKNTHINLSVLSSDLIQTAIKNLCDTLCTQEIGLAVEPNGAGTYSLNTKGNAYDQMISDLYLVDNYIDSVFEWHEGKEYVFQVDENAKSFAQGRFKLIIEKNTMEQPVISWHEGALVSSIGKRMQWMLNGEDIPGATAASFYPTVDGDYTVRLTDKACSKVSPAYSFRITGTGNPLLSEVKIYPNPVTNYIRVIGIDRSQAEVAYTITSLSGAVLQRGNVAYEDVSGEGEVKLKSLSTGLYILNVRDTSGAHQFKFSVH